MRVQTYPDLEALSNAAADELAAAARAARGACHVALSGGSTPKRMFEVLVARGRDALPWDRVELWWGDERTVPPDHPDSNYGAAMRVLAPLRLDPAHVHRMEGERAPATAAADYERELVGALGAPPVFDLVLLGLGPDGHTASLFPGTPAVTETERWVVANPVDSPVAKGKTTRLTLTAPAINAARRICFLVCGGDKAHVLRGVLEGPRGQYPAQLIGDATWMVDAAAGKELT